MFLFRVSECFTDKTLVPETPANKVKETVFNKRRIRKSMGATIVNESPDVKSEFL